MFPALLLALALAFAACGGEREFDAEEFAAAMNDEGAALEVGDPLPSTQEGLDIYAVTLEEGHDGEQEDAGEAGHAHGGGSLVVAENAEAAGAEHERCERALTLTCYRAANVVLYFELPPTDPELLEVDAAIRALASG